MVGTGRWGGRPSPHTSARDANFEESKHPRDQSGKFGSGGGGEVKENSQIVRKKLPIRVSYNQAAVGSGGKFGGWYVTEAEEVTGDPKAGRPYTRVTESHGPYQSKVEAEKKRSSL
jgi:hypothetical protein